jgi:hypothetical protein
MKSVAVAENIGFLWALKKVWRYQSDNQIRISKYRQHNGGQNKKYKYITHKTNDWPNILQLPSNMKWKLLHVLRHMCCMLEAYVLHDWGICAACLDAYVLHAWSICAAWLRHMCCMLEAYVLHDWGICAASVLPCKLDLLHACCI